MFTALLLDHVASTVVTGFNLSVLRGVNTVYVEGGLASQLMTRRRGEGRAGAPPDIQLAGVCAGGRIRLSPKDVSGDGARVCPPSTPHQLASVDVSTYTASSIPLYTGCAAAQSERCREEVRCGGACMRVEHCADFTWSLKCDGVPIQHYGGGLPCRGTTLRARCAGYGRRWCCGAPARQLPSP
jgi:hypothetical protein